MKDDVDVIVEIANYQGRSELQEKLRSLGFAHDIESHVVCRYKIHGIVADIMPTDDTSIGFNTKWCSEAFQKAIDYTIDADNMVKILTAFYFIATKLEAFNDRGKGDGRTGHDFEDIVYELGNRSSVWEEMNSLEGEIKNTCWPSLQSC